MAVIQYVTTGKQLTAARMNAVSAELDRKLSVIFHGKSFVLAFVPSTGALSDADTTTLNTLVGNQFFFSGSHCYYSQYIKNYVSGKSYNHNLFSSQQTLLQSTEDSGGFLTSAYDTTNKILTVNAVDSTTRTAAAIPSGTSIGFFEWSLQAHYVNHVEQVGQPAVKYYLKENILSCHPEKKYDWIVADIFLEGVTTLTYKREWDKYKFIRIHNLNKDGASITWELTETTTQVSTISAFGCKTFRRFGDSTSWTVSEDGVYLWRFRTGDPIVFQWQRTVHDEAGYSSVGNSNFVSNGACVNNVFSPAIMLDWMRIFTKPRSIFSNLTAGWEYTRRAWFENDPTLNIANYDTSDGVFPAITDETLIGDLVHHKGKILIVKYHKTQTMPCPSSPSGLTNFYWLGIISSLTVGTTLPLIAFDSLDFNGYSTIVQDFAAKGLTVEEVDGSSSNYSQTPKVLKISQPDDSEWNYILIPLTTNLLGQWDSLSGYIIHYSCYDLANNLSMWGHGGPVYLNNALFEIYADTTSGLLKSTYTNPIEVYQRAQVTTALSSRQWTNYGSDTIYITEGTDAHALQLTHTGEQSSVDSRWLMPIPKFWSTTVADLKTLKFFGSVKADGTLPSGMTSQSDQFTTYSDAELHRGPEGLILTFTETVNVDWPELPFVNFLTEKNDIPFSYYNYNSLADWTQNEDGTHSRQRCIRFRALGYGYAGGGGRTALFQHPRHVLSASSLMPKGDISAVSGADLSGWKDIVSDLFQTKFGYLQRIQNERIGVIQSIEPGLQYRCPDASTGGRFWEIDLTSQLRQIIQLLKAQAISSSIDTSLLDDIFPETTWSNGVASSGYPYDKVNTFSEHYNLLAQCVNQLVNGRVLPVDTLFFYVPSLSGFYNVQPCSYPGCPLPARFWAQTGGGYLPVPGTNISHHTLQPEALYNLLGIAIKTENDLPGDYVTLKTTPRTYKTIVFNMNVSGFVHNTDGYKATLDAIGWQYGTESTYNTGEALYSNLSSIHSYNLASVYAGFRWVSIDDVKEWCESIGWEFSFVEIGIPFSLKVLEKTGSVSPGNYSMFDGTHTVTGYPLETYDSTQTQGTQSVTPALGVQVLTSGLFLCHESDSSKVTWKLIPNDISSDSVSAYCCDGSVYNNGTLIDPERLTSSSLDFVWKYNFDSTTTTQLSWTVSNYQLLVRFQNESIDWLSTTRKTRSYCAVFNWGGKNVTVKKTGVEQWSFNTTTWDSNWTTRTNGLGGLITYYNNGTDTFSENVGIYELGDAASLSAPDVYSVQQYAHTAADGETVVTSDEIYIVSPGDMEGFKVSFTQDSMVQL